MNPSYGYRWPQTLSFFCGFLPVLFKLCRLYEFFVSGCDYEENSCALHTYRTSSFKFKRPGIWPGMVWTLVTWMYVIGSKRKLRKLCPKFTTSYCREDTRSSFWKDQLFRYIISGLVKKKLLAGIVRKWSLWLGLFLDISTVTEQREQSCMNPSY